MTHPVVLGLGGTVDFELHWSAATLQSLADEHGIRPDEITDPDLRQEIRDERSLVASILGFLRRGDGGERFVESSATLARFADRFGYAVTLGGTGVRAGLAALLWGIESTQHLVSIDDHVRRLLPTGIDVVCSADSDSTDPHLIVQYPAGARIEIGGTTLIAPAANRLIYVNDPPNRSLVLSERLPEALSGASLFLVSGFNSMQERNALEARVGELRAAMRSLPADAIVVFEDAGYHEPAYGPIVLAGLADRLDVYGLNEDELQTRIGRSVELFDPDDVARGLASLAGSVPGSTIVLHTRSYALVAGGDPERWVGALDAAVVTSGARYAWGDSVTPEQLDALAATGRRSSDGRRLVDELTARSSQVRGTPAFELEVERPTTIGLGDSFVGGFVAALERERLARS